MFTLETKIYLSCIDKFTKFPTRIEIFIYLRDKLVVALYYLTIPKLLVSDNKKGLLCPTVLNYLRTLFVELYYTLDQKSEVNGPF